RTKPRVLFSGYTVTARVLGEWLADPCNSPFEVVLYGTSLPPRELLARLMMRGARLLYPKPLRREESVDAVKNIQQSWRTRKDSTEYQTHFQVGHTSLETVFGAHFDRVVNDDFPLLGEYVAGLRDLLVRSHIDAVVVPFDTPIAERTLVSVANTLGI